MDRAFDILSKALIKNPKLKNKLPKNETFLPIMISHDELILVLHGEKYGGGFLIDTYMPPTQKGKQSYDSISIPPIIVNILLPMPKDMMDEEDMMDPSESLETPKDMDRFLKNLLDDKKNDL